MVRLYLIFALCNDEMFWKDKFANDFPDETLPSELRGDSNKEAYRRHYYSNVAGSWNVRKAARATEKAYFINAKNGASNLMPSSPIRWQLEHNVLYHTGYRIKGTSEQITQALRLAKIDDNTINNVLATAISGQNKDQEPYATMYKEEIEKRNKYVGKNKEKRTKEITELIGLVAQKLDEKIGWDQSMRYHWIKIEANDILNLIIEGFTKEQIKQLLEAQIEGLTIELVQKQIIIQNFCGTNYAWDGI